MTDLLLALVDDCPVSSDCETGDSCAYCHRGWHYRDELRMHVHGCVWLTAARVAGRGDGHDFDPPPDPVRDCYLCTDGATIIDHYRHLAADRRRWDDAELVNRVADITDDGFRADYMARIARGLDLDEQLLGMLPPARSHWYDPFYDPEDPHGLRMKAWHQQLVDGMLASFVTQRGGITFITPTLSSDGDLVDRLLRPGDDS